MDCNFFILWSTNCHGTAIIKSLISSKSLCLKFLLSNIPFSPSWIPLNHVYVKHLYVALSNLSQDDLQVGPQPIQLITLHQALHQDTSYEESGTEADVSGTDVSDTIPEMFDSDSDSVPDFIKKPDSNSVCDSNKIPAKISWFHSDSILKSLDSDSNSDSGQIYPKIVTFTRNCFRACQDSV